MSVLHSSVKYNNQRQKSAQRLALLVYPPVANGGLDAGGA